MPAPLSPHALACLPYYLAAQGWQRHVSSHPHLESWQHATAGVLVPRADAPDRDARTRMILSVIASVERRPVSAVRQAISTAVAL